MKTKKKKKKSKMTSHSKRPKPLTFVDVYDDDEDDSDYLICPECNTVYTALVADEGDQCLRYSKGEFCGGFLMALKIPEDVTNTSNVMTYPGNSGGTYKQCNHAGEKVVYTWNGKNLYAGSAHGLNEKSGKWDLIIDLAGIVYLPNVKPFIDSTSDRKWREKLGKFLHKEQPLPSEVLRLNWTDMGVPPVSLGFWTSLWDMLPKDTCISCFGGHGRTGTCLASLMIASGVDYYTAVKTVRKDHCSKAVESLEQEKYLHRIYMDYLKAVLETPSLGADVLEKAAKSLTYAAGHVPNASSSYGEKDFSKSPDDPPKVQKVIDITPDVPQPPLSWYQHERGDFVHQTFKREGGVFYVKECKESKCANYNCQILSHQKWVEWDESDTAWMSSV